MEMKEKSSQASQVKIMTAEKVKARIIVYSVILISVAHTIYMNVMGFTSVNHQQCFMFTSFPRWIMYLYENVVELLLMVVLGVFAGVLMEHYFRKIKRFYPKNQLLAFLYAAILPVCSCGVIPLIDSMKQRTSLKVIITFIIAAPLLNPYIVFLSFSVLGLHYALLRIVFSFLLAILTGLIVEFVATRLRWVELGTYNSCNTNCNPVINRDVFVQTMNIVRKLMPYVVIAGLLSYGMAFINPKQYLETLSFDVEPWSTLLIELIGIPLYVCNGADVVFLKPLLQYTDLTLGAAMAFSLTSSAICISSIIMLLKFLGKQVTMLLISSIFILTFLFSLLIQLIY